MNKYVGFENLQDIKDQFESDCDGLTDEEVIFASYGCGCFDGDAVVLFSRDGKLFTVESSHCSCYGLEGTWDAVETSKEVLKMRRFDLPDHKEFVEFLQVFLND